MIRARDWFLIGAVITLYLLRALWLCCTRRTGAARFVLLMLPALLLTPDAHAGFRAEIVSTLGNGPYCFVVYKNTVGQWANINVANVSAALDSARVQIGGRLGAETVRRVTWSVTTSNAALNFRAEIVAVAEGGPYAYVVYQGNTATEAGDAVANITNALNAVRDEIGSKLAGATVRRVAWGVVTSADGP